MQPQEPVGPGRGAILLRNVLIGATMLIVPSIGGAIGMSVLAGLRGPHRRQVVDHTGPLVRVVSVLPRDLSWSPCPEWTKRTAYRVLYLGGMERAPLWAAMGAASCRRRGLDLPRSSHSPAMASINVGRVFDRRGTD